MSSSKPYLIRALYDWISDDGYSPYILVHTDTPNCMVPEEYVKNNQIVLNITADVVSGLVLGNDAIEFKARFAGVPRQLYIPMASIVSIYAQETGQGMGFADEPSTEENTDSSKTTKKGRPDLKIVK